MAKQMEWMPSAFASMNVDAWRKSAADWIVTNEAGEACLDGHSGDVNPEPLAEGQMINFDIRPAGKPNELVEYITHIWADGALTQVEV